MSQAIGCSEPVLPSRMISSLGTEAEEEEEEEPLKERLRGPGEGKKEKQNGSSLLNGRGSGGDRPVADGGLSPPPPSRNHLSPVSSPPPPPTLLLIRHQHPSASLASPDPSLLSNNSSSSCPRRHHLPPLRTSLPQIIRPGCGELLLSPGTGGGGGSALSATASPSTGLEFDFRPSLVASASLLHSAASDRERGLGASTPDSPSTLAGGDCAGCCPESGEALFYSLRNTCPVL